MQYMSYIGSFSMHGIYFVRKWKPDGSKDTSETKLFHFHGIFKKKWDKISKANPMNLLSRYRESTHMKDDR